MYLLSTMCKPLSDDCHKATTKLTEQNQHKYNFCKHHNVTYSNVMSILVSDAHSNLDSHTNRPINEPWWYTKKQFSVTYFIRQTPLGKSGHGHEYAFSSHGLLLQYVTDYCIDIMFDLCYKHCCILCKLQYTGWTKKIGPFLIVYNSCIWWCRKAINILKCSTLSGVRLLLDKNQHTYNFCKHHNVTYSHVMSILVALVMLR